MTRPLLTWAYRLHRTRTFFWLAMYVMLTRCKTLDGLLLLRLPSRKAFEAGAPDYVKQEMARLAKLVTPSLQERYLQGLYPRAGCPRKQHSTLRLSLYMKTQLLPRHAEDPLNGKQAPSLLLALTTTHCHVQSLP